MERIEFRPMENKSEGSSFCGGFTYSLLYVAGGVSNEVALETFKIETESSETPHLLRVTGRPMSTEWIGQHKFVIKGQNGVLDNSTGARGYKGLFDFVLSGELLVEIVDPCLNTKLNSDNSFGVPSTLTVPSGKLLLESVFKGPKDSVSILYGNGFDLCGSRSYKIAYEDDGRPYDGDALSFHL